MRALLMTAKKKDYTSISFDFTDGTHTVSSLIDDGWTFHNSTATVDTTNGLYLTNGSDRMLYALDLSNAGKIEIKSKLKYTHIPQAYQLGMIEVLAGGQQGNIVYGELNIDGGSSTYTYSVADGGGSSDTGNVSVSSDGIYDTTFTIDIDNGTLTFKVEGYTELTTPLVSVSTVLNAYGVGYYTQPSNQYFTRSIMSMDIKIRPTTQWRPGANTVAYYPLNSTYNYTDQSGNENDLTNNGGVIQNYNGVSCAYYNNTQSYRTGFSTLPLGNSARTLSVWVNVQGGGTERRIVGYGNNSNNKDCTLVHNNYAHQYIFRHYNADSGLVEGVGGVGQWVNLVGVYDGTTTCIYVNGVAGPEINVQLATSSTSLYIGRGTYMNQLTGYVSEVIIEDKARTAQEISDYYNLTKDNYPVLLNNNLLNQNINPNINLDSDIHIEPTVNNGSGNVQSI